MEEDEKKESDHDYHDQTRPDPTRVLAPWRPAWLAALTQLAIVFFWGFDLNIKDFDLYMIPQTMFCLFLLKKTVTRDSPTNIGGGR